jgi:hypothetical protein
MSSQAIYSPGNRPSHQAPSARSAAKTVLITLSLCLPAALHAQTDTPPPPPGVAAQTPASAAAPGANTFGFYAGETKQQIIAAIGQAAVIQTKGDILEVNAAPLPNPAFDTFLLIVGPRQGLVKLIATGKDVEDDPAGKQIKAQFTTLKADLSKLYGEPGDVFDFINAKSTLKGPNQFMIALTKTERSLSAYWTKKDFGSQITSISLEGNGLGDDKGYLSLEFEFSGIHDYLTSTKK